MLERCRAVGRITSSEPAIFSLIVTCIDTGVPGSSSPTTISVGIPMAPIRSVSASFEIAWQQRSEEHTSELQSLMRISYAVFCLKKKNKKHNNTKVATIHNNVK